MAKELLVSHDKNVINENCRSFEERQAELAAIEQSEAMARKQYNRSAFARFTQTNLDRTKEILRLGKDSPTARRILDLFNDVMDRRNGIICSNQTLCEILEVSESSITRAIKILKERGFITVLKTGRENVYAVNHNIFWKNSGGKMWTSKFDVNVLISLNEQDRETINVVNDAIEAAGDLPRIVENA